MSPVASGHFDVNLSPAPLADGRPEKMGRLVIDKAFRGDLEGESRGEMLSAGAEVPESAGYVAVERFTGTLHGRGGAFFLQHLGALDRGAPSLTVLVVPDSGTDELTGLRGSMTIDPAAGHAYTLDYELPAS